MDEANAINRGIIPKGASMVHQRCCSSDSSKAASERGQTKACFQYAEREQARPKVKSFQGRSAVVGRSLVYRSYVVE